MDAKFNNNTAFYLKYRPQSLADLVGQDQVKKILSGAILQNRLSHAYLFVGPRGTGKTSTARILAKMVNCEKLESRVKSQESSEENPRPSTLATSDYPCNKCSICLSITDGSNLDLIEIDAASNRGIEDIRSLRDKIKLSPTSSKKKVYIIDEVHMLTTEAFNALLKTLEEPPSHALFILATTDVSKLPQTILSRVQRLDFKLASQIELTATLTKIIAEEKLEIDKEALSLIVTKAEGSFRDAVKFLDQLASIGKKITVDEVSAGLQTVLFESAVNIIDKLIEHNAKEAILLIQNNLEKGADAKILTIELIDLMRKILLIKHDLGHALVEKYYSTDKYKKLIRLAEIFEDNHLIVGLKSLQEGLEMIKFASIPSLPLELAVLEICQTEKVVAPIQSEVELDIVTTKPIMPSIVVVNEKIPASTESVIQESSSNNDILKIKEKWTFVLETIRPFNFSLEALLRSINIADCSETNIIMEVPYSFHQRILEAPKNRDLLESVFSDILGRTIHISTVLGKRMVKKEDVVNIEVAADDEIIRAAAEIFNSDSIN